MIEICSILSLRWSIRGTAFVHFFLGLLHVSGSVNAAEENVSKSLLQRLIDLIDSVPGTGVNHLSHAFCQYGFNEAAG